MRNMKTRPTPEIIAGLSCDTPSVRTGKRAKLAKARPFARWTVDDSRDIEYNPGSSGRRREWLFLDHSVGAEFAMRLVAALNAARVVLPRARRAKP